jgi:hypothetical protein
VLREIFVSLGQRTLCEKNGQCCVITRESLFDRARICWFDFEAHPRLTYKKFDRVLRMMLTLYPR